MISENTSHTSVPIQQADQNADALPQAPASPWSATPIEAVIREETAEVDRLWKQRNRSEVEGEGRFGLAFSGGGIRSAAVNLGLIQALARKNILSQMHYISGVSGGGYILGWLTAWIARAGFGEVQEELGGNSAEPGIKLPREGNFHRYLEPNPVHYLRRYVSFLIPRAGLGSGDTLAAIAITLRNVFLIQTMLAAAIVAIFSFLQFFTAPALMWHFLLAHRSITYFLLAIIVVTTVWLGTTTWKALGLLARNTPPATRKSYSATARTLGFLLCLFTWLILPLYPRGLHGELIALIGSFIWTIVFFGLGTLVAAWLKHSGSHSEEILKGVRPQDVRWARPLAIVGTGILVASLQAGFWRWLHPNGLITVVTDSYAVLGLPAILASAALVSFMYVGLFGDAFPDGKREWLGRLAGYFLYFAAIAAVVLFAVLLGPLCVHWIFTSADAGWKTGLKWLLPGGWLFTTLAGVFAARSPATGKNTKSPALDILSSVAPPVFLFGMMLFLSWGTHELALRSGGGEYLTYGYTVSSPAPQDASRQSVASVPSTVWRIDPLSSRMSSGESAAIDRLFFLFACTVPLACCLGWRVSVNEFSLHLFYRNRLVRTFLGASNVGEDGHSKRRPDPFTGFAFDDDYYLGGLQGAESKFDGPYPLWCTSLNLTRGEDLAWQERKAASFIYSPLFCGWDHVPSTVGDHAYRRVAPCAESGPTSNDGYGGKGGAPLIGTAMAASGAAISPNWGYHTKPAIAALLALFNVRIGWWTGNPLLETSYRNYSPGQAYFVSELLGLADERSNYVYLSDGGHFENLGIYELVRRRVRYIISCDADADPDYSFGDLSNAVEKCRVDFGVQIHFTNYTDIAPNPETGLSVANYAIGLIDYLPASAESPRETGILIYLKSSLTGKEPAQVLGQRAMDSTFPHDATLNQFYNETRFEAYRALGEYLGESVCKRMDELTSGLAQGADISARLHYFFNELIKCAGKA